MRRRSESQRPSIPDRHGETNTQPGLHAEHIGTDFTINFISGFLQAASKINFNHRLKNFPPILPLQTKNWTKQSITNDLMTIQMQHAFLSSEVLVEMNACCTCLFRCTVTVTCVYRWSCDAAVPVGPSAACGRVSGNKWSRPQHRGEKRHESTTPAASRTGRWLWHTQPTKHNTAWSTRTQWTEHLTNVQS